MWINTEKNFWEPTFVSFREGEQEFNDGIITQDSLEQFLILFCYVQLKHRSIERLQLSVKKTSFYNIIDGNQPYIYHSLVEFF